jgi:hypothetical protein
VIFTSTSVDWGNDELALGPDLIRMGTDNAVETGSFRVYDTDGTTLLYTTPLLTTRPGDVWQYIGQDNPLPVKLISFKVTKEGTRANLNWETTEEVNSDYFEVQHSPDAKVWKELGKVASSGDRKSYDFTHSSPSPSTNYYRLKMVDRANGNDAAFAYSRIQSVDFKDDLISAKYPNPVSDRLNLNPDQHITEVTIFDQSGNKRMISSKIENDGLDVSSLPGGLYLVQLKDSNGFFYTKTILVSH